MSYDFKAVEEKWQKVWEDNHAFEAKNDYTLPKFYALVEFPYPSGASPPETFIPSSERSLE